jgi:hypothetical protein
MLRKDPFRTWPFLRRDGLRLSARPLPAVGESRCGASTPGGDAVVDEPRALVPSIRATNDSSTSRVVRHREGLVPVVAGEDRGGLSLPARSGYGCCDLARLGQSDVDADGDW